MPVCPRFLVTPDRYDLPIKWRFFRHLMGCNDPDSERVYRWHIKTRTGGREPGSWKQSLNDYVVASRSLFQSMQSNGFDPEYPIKIGSDGKQRGGAHRTASAIVLGIDVFVKRVDAVKRVGPWGRAELVRYGISAADLARVDDDFQRMLS